MPTMTSYEARAHVLSGKPLPESLSVGGWLNLAGCTGLTALPESLSVSGWLNLTGCTGLTALPENLSVGGWLCLTGCTGLRHYELGTDQRGYVFFAIPMKDGLHIVAGCRNLHVDAALQHWANNPECLAFVKKAIERHAIPV